MPEPWQVVSSRVTYEDQWLRLRTDNCVTATGHVIGPYHVLEAPTWMHAVALTSDLRIVLVREYRHGAGEVLTGLPGGCMEPGDADPETAMRRELQEETGFTGGVFFPATCMYANPAKQTNHTWSFLATGVQRTHEQHVDPNEDIEVVCVPFQQLVRQVWTGGTQFHGVEAAAFHAAVQVILASNRRELAGVRRTVRSILLSL